jgi:hypothetical protein
MPLGLLWNGDLERGMGRAILIDHLKDVDVEKTAERPVTSLAWRRAGLMRASIGEPTDTGEAQIALDLVKGFATGRHQLGARLNRAADRADESPTVRVSLCPTL